MGSPLPRMGSFSPQTISAGISNYRLPNNVDNVVNFIYADGHIGMLPIEEFPKVIGAPYSDSWYFWKGLLD